MRHNLYIKTVCVLTVIGLGSGSLLAQSDFITLEGGLDKSGTRTGCSNSKPIPSSQNGPKFTKTKAISMLNDESDRELYLPRREPFTTGDAYFSLKVSKDDVFIDTKLVISVQSKAVAKSYDVAVEGECGGVTGIAGTENDRIIHTSEIILNNSRQRYSKNIKMTLMDAATADQSYSIESNNIKLNKSWDIALYVPYKCTSSGIFRLTMKTSFQVKTQMYYVNSPFQVDVLCPKKLRVWAIYVDGSDYHEITTKY